MGSKDIKREIADKYNYTINKKKHEDLVKEFRHISKSSLYATHLKIACQEHCKFLNNLPQETKDKMIRPKNPKKAVLLMVGDEFRPNLKFINQCIQNAKENNQYLSFEFFQSNIVLDKLKESLKNRKKK